MFIEHELCTLFSIALRLLPRPNRTQRLHGLETAVFHTNICCYQLTKYYETTIKYNHNCYYLEVGGENRREAEDPHRESKPSAHAPAPHARHDRSMVRSCSVARPISQKCFLFRVSAASNVQKTTRHLLRPTINVLLLKGLGHGSIIGSQCSSDVAK